MSDSVYDIFKNNSSSGSVPEEELALLITKVNDLRNKVNLLSSSIQDTEVLSSEVLALTNKINLLEESLINTVSLDSFNSLQLLVNTIQDNIDNLDSSSSIIDIQNAIEDINTSIQNTILVRLDSIDSLINQISNTSNVNTTELTLLKSQVSALRISLEDSNSNFSSTFTQIESKLMNLITFKDEVSPELILLTNELALLQETVNINYLNKFTQLDNTLISMNSSLSTLSGLVEEIVAFKQITELIVFNNSKSNLRYNPTSNALICDYIILFNSDGTVTELISDYQINNKEITITDGIFNGLAKVNYFIGSKLYDVINEKLLITNKQFTTSKPTNSFLNNLFYVDNNGIIEETIGVSKINSHIHELDDDMSGYIYVSYLVEK